MAENTDENGHATNNSQRCMALHAQAEKHLVEAVEGAV